MKGFPTFGKVEVPIHNSFKSMLINNFISSYINSYININLLYTNGLHLVYAINLIVHSTYMFIGAPVYNFQNILFFHLKTIFTFTNSVEPALCGISSGFTL